MKRGRRIEEERGKGEIKDFPYLMYLGKEVAKFCEKHFCEELKKNPNFLSGAYEIALQETFLKMDVLLQTPEGKRELTILKMDKDDSKPPSPPPFSLQADSYAGCTANVTLIARGN